MFGLELVFGEDMCFGGGVGGCIIVRARLTFMEFPYMGAAIAFHSEPVITCSKDLPGHSMPIGMCPK